MVLDSISDRENEYQANLVMFSAASSSGSKRRKKKILYLNGRESHTDRTI